MKRSLAALLSLLILVSIVLTACGGTSTETSASSKLEPLDVEPSHDLCVFLDTTSEFCMWVIQYPESYKFDWEGAHKVVVSGDTVQKSREIPGNFSGTLKSNKKACRKLGTWSGVPGQSDPSGITVNIAQSWTYYGCPQ